MRGMSDLFRVRIFGVVALGMGLTILLFVALQALIFWAIRAFGPDQVTVPWIGPVEIGGALSWGSLALFPVIGFLLMAPVAAGFAGLFSEQVAESVERIHYPSRAGEPTDFLDGLLESLAVVAAALGIAVVLLIASPFLGPLAPVAFYLANGWLLGREFFAMAARRHMAADQADELRRIERFSVVALGVAIAALLTVPVVNIAVPVLAAASFTHLFHGLTRPAD
ncbi:EI24 domain-containing protein [Paracoccus sp. Z118]|nr:EI24 domain-containing protein [Paracoccus sp. Z118]